MKRILFPCFALFAISLSAQTESTNQSQGPAAIYKDANGTIYANSRVNFALNATDNLSEVDYIEYKIDDTEFKRYTAPFPLSGNGPHVIIYRAVDKAGNKEVDRVYHVTIDDNAPDVKLLPGKQFVVRDGKSYTSSGNTLTFRVVDDYSGIKSVKYSVNSGELRTYNNETIQLTNPGPQNIQFQAEDNLGNKSTSGTLSVEVDAKAPTVEIVPSAPLIQVGEKSYAKKSTAFKINAVDEGAGVEQILIKIDDAQDWQTYSEALYFDQEKPHSIQVKAIDSVGNESEMKTIQFIVDDNPPSSEIKATIE